MRNFRDQRIAHAERAVPIGHAVISPSLWEALELIEFIGNEAAQPTILHHDMLDAARSATAFAGQDGAAWLVRGIGESHGTFRVDVLVAVLRGASLAFPALEVFSRLEAVPGDEELLGDFRCGYEYVSDCAILSVVHRFDSVGHYPAVLHDASFPEAGNLVAASKALR